jgi:anthranilate phosphoribosyltransferase
MLTGPQRAGRRDSVTDWQPSAAAGPQTKPGPTEMSIAPYLRLIGRGAEGSRPLKPEQAHDLMAQLLDERLSPLEVGGFAIGMRMKGETLDELQGFVQALHERLTPLASDRPVISIASYNGARRLPNLVPLLALLLARGGARVLVHGLAHDPDRVTTAQVFEALGHAPALSPEAVGGAWQRHGCAFVPTPVLSPALERLLQVRRTLGLRNSGHTIAKMLNPVRGAPCLRLLSHTHPEFGSLMAGYAERAQAHMGVLRGTEGEAVADPRRLPRQQIWVAGVAQSDLASEPEPGSLATLPELPKAIDPASTAAWIGAALRGEQPVPLPIVRQTELLLAALARLPATAGSAGGSEAGKSD